ncbi:MAG: demethylmenaquinone methyltransferase [Mycobacteriales bacterium]
MVRASLAKEPDAVAAMFDGVAGGYDRTNTVMTGGMDRYWRRATVRAVGLRPGERALDLAAGTAVSTVELTASGGAAVACDFSLGMLRAGAARGVPKVAGDAAVLPFRDESFDAVTMSFGLRNVSDVDAVLREMGRVTRPGGRLLICEVSHPPFEPIRAGYGAYMRFVMPRLARIVSTSPEAYLYLAESAKAWPTQRELAERITAAGWRRVGWRNLTGGVVALHRGFR